MKIHNNLIKKLRYIKRMFRVVYSSNTEFDKTNEIMILSKKDTQSKQYYGMWVFPKKPYKLPRRYKL